MKRALQWSAAIVACIALVAAAAWLWVGGAEGVVARALPRFPQWPAPATTLADGRAGRIYFESSTPYDFDVLLAGPAHALPTTGVGTLVVPAQASAAAPVPAMVLLHGSGGIKPGREMRMAETLADHGIAAFVVDYYAPRGIVEDTDYMSRVLAVTEFDAVADAYAALRLLRTHPAIDPRRIGVMGFSYGGMATRIALDERVRRAQLPEGPGFAAFVDTYGPCFQDFGTREASGAPLLTLRGTEDASNDLAACAQREDALRAIGVPVEAHVFEGAGHAWENDAPRALVDAPYVTGCTMRYDERGHAFFGDAPIVDVPLDTPREARIAKRIASGGSLGDCVKHGYLVGRDDATRARALGRLLDFLDRALAPASAGAPPASAASAAGRGPAPGR